MADFQRNFFVRARRGIRPWLAALALAGLAFTAVQVSAIWQQPDATAVPAPTRSSAVPKEVDLANRIDRRLQLNPLDLEASLLRSLLHFKTGDLGPALELLDDLTRKAPNFQLAHLIRGDLLLAQFRPLENIGQNGVVDSLGREGTDLVEGLREEARARLQGYLSLLDDQKIPDVLITLASDLKWALAVDKSRNRLYLFENSSPDRPPRLIADYYCVFGKQPGNKQQRGDLKTPEGVYFITGHIPGEKLPSRYGLEAYPLNYPNEFDRRRGKTGSGIWLHGTDLDYYSRPPQDSDGCVVLANDDLQALRLFLQPGQTPMVIADRLDWISPMEWRSRRESFVAVLDTWRQDWESDIERYLAHYSKTFRSDSLDYTGWRRRKEQLARQKSFQQVRLERMSLYGYPAQADNEGDMVVADFYQTYRSDTFSSEMEKRLYLVKEDQHWRIWYEGSR